MMKADMMIQGITASYVEHNVGYLPMPNSIEMMLTNVPPPDYLISEAFLVPVNAEGEILFAHSKEKGLKFAGGAIRKKETALQAAMREAKAQIGATCSRIEQIGYLRMVTKSADAMEQNIAFHVFYAGEVESMPPYLGKIDYLRPEKFKADEIEYLDGHIGKKARYLHAEALRVLNQKLAA